jgi:hypothetical protein
MTSSKQQPLLKMLRHHRLCAALAFIAVLISAIGVYTYAPSSVQPTTLLTSTAPNVYILTTPKQLAVLTLRRDDLSKRLKAVQHQDKTCNQILDNMLSQAQSIRDEGKTNQIPDLDGFHADFRDIALDMHSRVSKTC